MHDSAKDEFHTIWFSELWVEKANANPSSVALSPIGVVKQR